MADITITKTTTTPGGTVNTPMGSKAVPDQTSVTVETYSITADDVSTLEAMFPGLAGSGVSLATATAQQLAAVVPPAILQAAYIAQITAPKA